MHTYGGVQSIAHVDRSAQRDHSSEARTIIITTQRRHVHTQRKRHHIHIQRTYAYAHVEHIRIHIYTCKYIIKYTYARMHVCMHLCTCTPVHLYTYKTAYTCTCVLFVGFRVYGCICMGVWVYGIGVWVYGCTSVLSGGWGELAQQHPH